MIYVLKQWLIFVLVSVAQDLDQITEKHGNTGNEEEDGVFYEEGTKLEDGEDEREAEVDEVDSDFAEDLEEEFDE